MEGPGMNQEVSDLKRKPDQKEFEAQQKIWVKEQEINALKVQNRHLIAKLEEAEQGAKPNQINTQLIAEQISSEIKSILRPAIAETQKQNTLVQAQMEKSLTQAFEMMQNTLRGVYQQSQRSQEAVDSLTEHSRDLEARNVEVRKNDQIFYQEKIFSLLVTFFERVERQLDQRLGVLSSIEHMITKQNEMLTDVEAVRGISLSTQKITEANRGEVARIEKSFAETTQKFIEVEVQARNIEEMIRDAYQQIQNHRAEFKLVKGEIRAMIEHTAKLNEKITIFDDRMSETVKNIQEQSKAQDRIREELKVIEANDTLENLIDVKTEDINAIQNVINSGTDTPLEGKGTGEEDKEDLVMILELLKAQKNDLKKVANEAETYLKDYREQIKGTEPRAQPEVRE